MVLMFYCLCEGEAGKSEYTFIDAVIKEFCTCDIELIAAAGARNILNKFNDISTRFCAGDTFVLVFDMVETLCNKPTLWILNEIADECIDSGVAFKYTNYYCFEELFLSYSGILDILDDTVLVRELIKVRRSILSGGNYFRGDISFWQNYFSNESGVLRTRETLSSGICGILRNVKGSFGVQKSKIGTCWVTDCSKTNLHKNVCNSCNYRKKSCVFREKLLDLESGSVVKSGILFSEMFKV